MKIRIGSRTSKLALKQVEIAMKRIGVSSFEIIGVDTAGDKSSRENKVQFDKKNFVEDIDNLLVDKKIDIAIHSAKDMPAVSNISELDEIYISNDLVQSNEKYNSRNDILIFRKNEHPVFKKNMKIGTSSLRRKLQSKFFLEALSSIYDLIDTVVEGTQHPFSVLIMSLFSSNFFKIFKVSVTFPLHITSLESKQII